MKGALSRFLALCGTAEVPSGSILLIENLDRLSRECSDDAWQLFRSILLTGVEIVILSSGKWYTAASLNSLEDRILVQLEQRRAHDESARKSALISDAWSARRRQARDGAPRPTNLPAWIERGADGALSLIPDRTETIRRMAALAVEGFGVLQIAATLNSGPAARPCWLVRGEWTAESVHHILSGLAVRGAWQPRAADAHGRPVATGDVIEGVYPAALDAAAAAAVSAALRRRRPARGRPCKREPHALAGLLFDAESGLPLHFKRGGDNQQYPYIALKDGAGMHVVCPYSAVESLVLRAVQKWSPDAMAPSASASDGKAAADGMATLARIAADRATLRAALAKPGRAAATVAAAMDALDEIAVEEAAVQAALDNAADQSGAVPPAALRDGQALASAYAALPADERPAAAARLNARLRQILCGVWVYRRRWSKGKGEVLIQVWPLHGPAVTDRVCLGVPPADYVPVSVGGADFRAGFPAARTSSRGRKNASA